MLQASTSFLLTVNGGAPQVFAANEVDIVTIDALDGRDIVTFNGSANDETANLTPGFGAIRQGTDYAGTNYAALAVNAEEVIAILGAGNDTAILRDTPMNDELTENAGTVSLSPAAVDLIARTSDFETGVALYRYFSG